MAVLKVFDDTKGHGVCRSCHASVTWFQLTSGKRMPFDAIVGDPVYIKTEHDVNQRLIGHLDATMYKTHFETCPDRDQWRRRK